MTPRDTATAVNLDLYAIASRAANLCRCDDPECRIERVDHDVPALVAEVERLRAERDTVRAETLREIVADVEARLPRLRDPDPLSDWGQGVAWMLDRLTNIANAASPAPTAEAVTQ